MDAGSQQEERTIIDLRTAPAAPPATARQTALRRHLAEFAVLVSPDGRLLDAVDVPPELDELRRAHGRHVAELVHPDDLPLILATATRALREPGLEHTATVRLRRTGGGWLTVDMVAVDARADDALEGLVVRIRAVDPTSAPPAAVLVEPHQHTPDASAEGGSRFISLAEALPLGILSADGFGTVVYANGAAENLLDAGAGELLGSGWERAVHPEDRPSLVDAVALVLDAGVRQHVEFRLAHDDGRWIAALLVPLGDPARPAGWLATIDDVTDRRRTQLQLTHQATHDPLTRLPNRTLLEDRLLQAGERLRRHPGETVVSVLFVDLDKFKDINDNHGHGAGDRVLVELGRRLQSTIRASDTVARYGGDEFVAVCESATPADVDALVARIREAIATPVPIGGLALDVGATIGVATTDVALEDMRDLLLQADHEMYRRKRRR